MTHQWLNKTGNIFKRALNSMAEGEIGKVHLSLVIITSISLAYLIHFLGQQQIDECVIDVRFSIT